MNEGAGNMNRPIRVLFVFHDLTYGGVPNVMLNICKAIPKEKVQFDLLTFKEEVGEFEKEFLEYGGKIYKGHVKEYAIKSISRILEFIPRVYSIVKILKENGPYDVVHSHHSFDGAMPMLAAYISRVPIRILHSHFSNLAPANIFDAVYRRILRSLCYLFATHQIGCTEEACKWLYGENCFKDKRTQIIYNSIDLKKFNSSKIDKEKQIQELGLNDEEIQFVHVGRFEEVKNHKFIIDVFYELTKMRQDIHLTLVGQGSLVEEIKERVRNYGLDDKVTFFGTTKKIENVLGAMDAMIFPSLYEGLGIALIEAQAMNIKCFVSECIPKAAQLGLCSYLPLKSSKEWAEYINNYYNNSHSESVNMKLLEQYSLDNIGKAFLEIYESRQNSALMRKKIRIRSIIGGEKNEYE